MPFIMNAWYAAAWPNEIAADRVFARTICNESMVFWRDSTGAAVALEDRCTHRQMPLAKGWLEDGTIRCSYHGLRFAGDGSCVEIPGQNNIPAGVRVRRYPVAERHGWVWVWPGDPARADAALIPDIQTRNESPGWTSVGSTTHVAANYLLLSDNLLDLTHETFLHVGSLGNHAVVEHPMETRTEGDRVVVTRWMRNHIPAPFWKANIRNATGYEGLCDRWQIIEFRPPAHLVLDVGVAPAGDPDPMNSASGAQGCNLNTITPETEHTSWFFWAFSRRFQLDDTELSARFLDRVTGIIEEDRVAIEAVQNVIDRDGPERLISLRTDAGGIAARRIIERLIRAEAAEAAAPDRTTTRRPTSRRAAR